MNRLLSYSPLQSDPAVPCLKVLLVYEDIIAGQLGREVAHQFSGQEADDVSLAAWNMDLIEEPYFADFIADQANHADLIIVAVRGAKAFTSRLKGWIERWSLQKGRKLRALAVVMEEPDRPGCARVQRFLEGIADKARMDCFRNAHDGCGFEKDISPRHEALWLL